MNFEEIHFHRSFVNPLSQCGGFDYPKNYTLIFYSFYVPHSFILNLSVKSSCKSFVKLLSPIGGSDRHISCTSRSSVPASYSHAMVGDGLMLLGKIIWEFLLSHVTFKNHSFNK